VLSNFFRAARVRDNVTLGNLSAVSFDARTEGAVQDFTITNVGEEQRRTLPIRELTEAIEKAKADDEELAQRKKVYQDANMPALQRVVKAEQAKADADRALTPRSRTAWTKWRQEQNESTRRIADARAKLASEVRQAAFSLSAPGRDDVDVSKMNVEVLSKVVTVNAQVRTPDGQTVPKTIAVTLQRAVGKQGDQTLEGRWLITAIQQQASASTT
jgi:hypothetical protein